MIIKSIQDFCAEKAILLKVLSTDSSDKPVMQVAKAFNLDLKNKYLWECISIGLSFHYKPGGKDWEKLMLENLLSFGSSIFLVVTDDEFFPWPVVQLPKVHLIELLNSLHFFEYFVFDEFYNKILFDTHENKLIVTQLP